MKKYLGVKIIHAEPMTNIEFAIDVKNENILKNSGLKDGYKVVYEGGYVSWLPRWVFEEAYRRIDNLTFGLAIEALKQGKKVARSGWNGKEMFIFMRPADDISINDLLKVKSLPNKVKDYYELKHQPITSETSPSVHFGAYICMKAADDNIVNGWLASQTDMLAEDWHIIE